MLQMLLDMITTKVLFFALHINNTGSFPPPLNTEEEQTCLVAYAAGDQAARDKLIEHNLRLAIFIKSLNKKLTLYIAPSIKHLFPTPINQITKSKPKPEVSVPSACRINRWSSCFFSDPLVFPRTSKNQWVNLHGSRYADFFVSQIENRTNL